MIFQDAELIKLDVNVNLLTQIRGIKNLLDIARTRGLHEVPDVTNWPVNQIYHIPPQEDGCVLILSFSPITVFYILITISVIYIFQMFMFPLCSEEY